MNLISLTYPDGKEVVPLSKDLVEGIPKDTLYRQVASGGGGFGDPQERDKDAVRMDVRNGVVSGESAREDYGI